MSDHPMTDQPPPMTGRFLHRPEPKAIGHAGRGHQIIDGELRFGGTLLQGDPFAAETPPSVQAELHGFGWLDDLAAVATPRARAVAQDRVLDWCRRNRQPRPDAPQWAPEITGRRLLRWVFHAGMILPGLDRDASAPFFASLAMQIGHLQECWFTSPDGLPRLETLVGMAIAVMSLEGQGDLVQPVLITLAEEIDAMGLSTLAEMRSPEFLLEAMALLVWTQEVADQAGITPPDDLRQMIATIAPVLRALRHADGALPCFHGGGRGAAGRLDHCLRAADGPALPQVGLAMGFAHMARGRTTLILDAASPPGGLASVRAHASTLGFELTVHRQPLIVNCGPGDGFGPLWARASRATPCHSALCLAGLSSSRLNRARLEGEPDILAERPTRVWAGDCDSLGNLLPADFGQAHSHEEAHLLAGHDGWLDSHGLTHVRELWLDPDGTTLRGEDSLAALDEPAQARLEAVRPPSGLGFEIRFHLHPDIRTRTLADGVRLTLPSGEEWQFSHDGLCSLRLDPSCLLDRAMPQPRPSRQIVLSGHLHARAIQICWTLARCGAR